jgi:hypothetical protein
MPVYLSFFSVELVELGGELPGFQFDGERNQLRLRLQPRFCPIRAQQSLLSWKCFLRVCCPFIEIDSFFNFSNYSVINYTLPMPDTVEIIFCRWCDKEIIFARDNSFERRS